jgi:5-formyltetrahydrofolate cyclo-ligase
MMIFLSFGSEVNTDYIVEWGWRRGKRILVPSCKPETRELIISPITSFDQVAPGYFGIREPKREFLKPVSTEEIDLVVVPAVAFDRRGYRVGYGGGYYDRFLTGMDVPKIGLAFSCQIIPEAPISPYDLPVDGIVTEKEYIRTRGGVKF